MRIFLSVAAMLCVLLLLSGCAGAPVTNTIETSSASGPALQGIVHGGQNPIANASVYLYAVNNTGYGGASVSLLTNPVTTASDGTFTITGDYNCPSATPLTYIYTVGGNSGSGTNSAATLMAGAGNCTHSGFTSKFIMVNEVSTIATVYAVAGYIVDPTHASTGTSTLSQTGLANAGNTIGNLYTQSTGVALATTEAGNGTVPQAEINTLANILAACINTNGSTAPGSACSSLFANALSGGTTGAQPTDTATAAINIAHNPGANVANLFALQGGSPPFIPDLGATPNDFTIGINYTASWLDQPWALAIDGSGNVWVTDELNDSLSELNSSSYGTGAGGGNSGSNSWNTNSPITSGGLANGYPDGIAIDSSGNVWVSNRSNNSLSEFNSSGSPVSNSPFSGGGLYEPGNIAIDQSGYLWIANPTDASGDGSISKFTSGGSPVSGSPFSGGGLIDPLGIAIDVSGHIWATNPEEYTLSELNSSGTAMSPGAGWGNSSKMEAPTNLAIDASGNLWVADGSDFISALSEYTPSAATPPVAGAWSSASPIYNGGLGYPWGVAIDGAGNIWMSNSYNSYAAVSEFSSSGAAITPQNSTQNGYIIPGAQGAPMGIAIDGSGNVWVANSNGTAYGHANGSVGEYVGAATPVVTPVVANLLSPYGAAAVNKP